MRKWLAHTIKDFAGNDETCEAEFELELTPLEVAKEFAGWPAHEQAQCLLRIAREFEERGEANAKLALHGLAKAMVKDEYRLARDWVLSLAWAVPAECCLASSDEGPA